MARVVHHNTQAADHMATMVVHDMDNCPPWCSQAHQVPTNCRHINVGLRALPIRCNEQLLVKRATERGSSQKPAGTYS